MGSSAFVLGPLLAKLVEGLHKLRLSLVPHGNLAEIVGGPSAQLQHELVAKDAVHALHKLELAHDLLHHLVFLAENVGIVLLKAANASESLQSARIFVAVQHSKVRKPNREILVAARQMAEHQTMARAIHGFESPLFLVDVE